MGIDKSFSMTSQRNWNVWKIFIYCFPAKLQMHNMFPFPIPSQKERIFMWHLRLHTNDWKGASCIMLQHSLSSTTHGIDVCTHRPGEEGRGSAAQPGKIATIQLAEITDPTYNYHGFTVNFRKSCWNHWKTSLSSRRLNLLRVLVSKGICRTWSNLSGGRKSWKLIRIKVKHLVYCSFSLTMS